MLRNAYIYTVGSLPQQRGISGSLLLIGLRSPLLNPLIVMVVSRSALLLCVAIGAAVGSQAAFFGRDADIIIKTPVLFFDNKDLDGGSQNFPVVIPPEGGCTPCENLVRSLC